jgi:PAS domain S-box-containing protein
MKDERRKPSTRFHLYFWVLAGAWTVCIVASLLWNVHRQQLHSIETAHSVAQIVFENDVLYRHWVAHQGGLYARVTPDTPPNPYLGVPDRDVTTTTGVALTLLNPAYLARLVNETAGTTAGSRGHITSLKPIRPENAPDAWEAAALHSFERGVKETTAVAKMGDGEYLRLMRPFVTEERCLTCHASQGYKPGEIRGGISVLVPMAPLRAGERLLNAHMLPAHLGLWLIGLTGIGLFRRNLGRQMLDREQAEEAHHRSEALLRAVLDSSPDPIFLKDTDGRLLLANPATFAVIGKPASAVLGKTDAEFYDDPDTGRAIMENDRRIMSSGQMEVIEERVTDPAGTRVYLSTKTPYRDAEGQIIGLIGMTRNITDRKRAEEALRESEQRVRRKLESVLSPEGDLGALELADLIDAPALQRLMDDFYAVARIPMAILDVKGRLLVGVGWQDICTQFHRVHPDTCRHCLESDTELTAGLARGNVRLYKCKNHLWDMATPIFVGDQKVGNIFTGQFFFEGETFDREFFRAQARQYGFDEEDYLAALDRTPRLSRDTVDRGMAFFIKLADTLSQLGLSNVTLARLLAERKAAEDRVRQAATDLAAANEGLRASRSAALNLMEDADTARRRAEQAATALRDSEERLRLLGDNLPDSAVYQYVHEADGSVRFLYFSAGVEWMNGVSVEEVLRDAGVLHRQSPPEYIALLVEAEAISKRDLSDFDMELPMLRPDGEVRWMRLHSRPRRLADGRTLWDGVQIDITDRKRAEEAIQRHLEELRALNDELARFNDAAVGRELRIVELKQQVNEYCARAGQPPRYPLNVEKDEA